MTGPTYDPDGDTVFELELGADAPCWCGAPRHPLTGECSLRDCTLTDHPPLPDCSCPNAPSCTGDLDTFPDCRWDCPGCNEARREDAEHAAYLAAIHAERATRIARQDAEIARIEAELGIEPDHQPAPSEWKLSQLRRAHKEAIARLHTQIRMEW